MIEPGEGTLNHPTAWQHNKALFVIGPQNNLETETAMFRHPVEQRRPALAAVQPNETQLLASTGQALKDELGPVAFRQRGRRDDDHE